MTIYQFHAKTIEGQEISLEQFAGKVILIVNTASKCGFTQQYEGLEEIYEMFKDRGFVVLGFPCNQFMHQEPGNEQEIKAFCELTYHVTFPMFAKVDVKGKKAHPIFEYLTDNAPGLFGSKPIKWNFTKFLIDSKGKIMRRYSPSTKPSEIIKDIKALL